MAMAPPRSSLVAKNRVPVTWALRGLDTLTRVANTRPLRRVSESLLALLLRHPRWLPGARIERAARAYLRTDTPCANQPSSPHYRFVHWYLDHFGERTIGRAREFLGQTPPPVAAARIDRFVRLALFAELRAALLARYKGQPGVPVAPLNQVQVALYPHCDLSCTGCYTAEDRKGPVPGRADIGWLLDEVEACGAHFIHLIGKGEPFLSPSFAGELLDAIDARPHLLFTIVTHGLRITRPLAARLAALGNVIVLVSIDGPPAIHDARRGAGTYQRAMAGLSLLREHGVLFGYSTTVTALSHRAVVAESFVAELAAAGASVGMYTRYFALSPQAHDTLALSPPARAEYQAAFRRLRDQAPIPLLDLDDIEEHTGCHSRAGESIYIDGQSGAVKPCLRVPFAPPDCRIDRASGRRLAAVLAHPFFVRYRQRPGDCPSWCGADLPGELRAVEQQLHECGAEEARLAGYRERSAAAGRTRRHLHILDED
jgi:hypothetical protein